MTNSQSKQSGSKAILEKMIQNDLVDFDGGLRSLNETKEHILTLLDVGRERGKELAKQLKELPVVGINGSGTFNSIEINGIKNGLFNVKTLPHTGENGGQWNVGWLAVEYRHIYKLIATLSGESQTGESSS